MIRAFLSLHASFFPHLLGKCLVYLRTKFFLTLPWLEPSRNQSLKPQDTQPDFWRPEGPKLKITTKELGLPGSVQSNHRWTWKRRDPTQTTRTPHTEEEVEYIVVRQPQPEIEPQVPLGGWYVVCGVQAEIFVNRHAGPILPLPPWTRQHLPLGVRIKVLNYGHQGHFRHALTDGCLLLQFLPPQGPNHAQGHPWPSCCRTWTCVSSNRRSSSPLPPLHSPAWPVSLPHPLSALPSFPRRKLSLSSKSGVFSSFTSLVTDGIFHFYDSQVIPFFPAEQYTVWRQELCLVCLPVSKEKAHGIISFNCGAGPSALQMCAQENIKNTNMFRVMKHNLQRSYDLEKRDIIG